MQVFFPLFSSKYFSSQRSCSVEELFQKKIFHCLRLRELPRNMVLFIQINVGFIYLYLLDFNFITVLPSFYSFFFFSGEKEDCLNYFSIRYFLTKYVLPTYEGFKEQRMVSTTTPNILDLWFIYYKSFNPWVINLLTELRHEIYFSTMKLEIFTYTLIRC